MVNVDRLVGPRHPPAQGLLQARLLAVRGRWEDVDGVQHLVAGELHDLSHLLGALPLASRDFH